MDISLEKIKSSLEGIEAEGWDQHTFNYMEDAINSLKKLCISLNGVTVKGKNNIDVLLGCMMALERIIGDEIDYG